MTLDQDISASAITAGRLRFTPDANENGSPYATIGFKVGDGTDFSSSAYTLTVTVNSVNDAPSGTNNTVTTNEDTTYTFTTANFGFTDPNDAPANALLAVKIVTVPSAGVLKLGTTTLVGGEFVSAAAITDGQLTFTPAPDANNTNYASFTFQVQDDGGTLNGGANLDLTPNTISVNVTAVNDEPVAFGDTNAADPVVEAGVYPGNTPFAGDPLAIGNVLANDTDVDTSDIKTVFGAQAGASAGPISGGVGETLTGIYGSLVLAADGSWTYTLDNLDPNTNALEQNRPVVDPFSYTMTDGHGGYSTAILNINITGTNDAPIAQTLGLGLNEQSALAGTLSGPGSIPSTTSPASRSIPQGPSAASPRTPGFAVFYDPNNQFEYLAVGETRHRQLQLYDLRQQWCELVGHRHY